MEAAPHVGLGMSGPCSLAGGFTVPCLPRTLCHRPPPARPSKSQALQPTSTPHSLEKESQRSLATTAPPSLPSICRAENVGVLWTPPKAMGNLPTNFASRIGPETCPITSDMFQTAKSNPAPQPNLLGFCRVRGQSRVRPLPLYEFRCRLVWCMPHTSEWIRTLQFLQIGPVVPPGRSGVCH